MHTSFPDTTPTVIIVSHGTLVDTIGCLSTDTNIIIQAYILSPMFIEYIEEHSNYSVHYHALVIPDHTWYVVGMV